jgi:hypothetical protein
MIIIPVLLVTVGGLLAAALAGLLIAGTTLAVVAWTV